MLKTFICLYPAAGTQYLRPDHSLNKFLLAYSAVKQFSRATAPVRLSAEAGIIAALRKALPGWPYLPSMASQCPCFMLKIK